VQDVATSCTDITQLKVSFQVYTSGLTPTLITNLNAAVNSSGNAGAYLTLSVGTYSIVAALVPNSCWAAASDSALLTVDYGSTDRRVTGGGWIADSLSRNGKANFGFTVGFNKNGTLKGSSVYMLRGTDGFNYMVKATSWNGAYLTFTTDPTIGKVTRARYSSSCVIQQINPLTDAVVWSQGNCTYVVDILDGDQYNPPVKDQYAISVFLPGGTTLWWGSSSTLSNLGGSGPGGGNLRIFSGN
jgi:hypothetical protein